MNIQALIDRALAERFPADCTPVRVTTALLGFNLAPWLLQGRDMTEVKELLDRAYVPKWLAVQVAARLAPSSAGLCAVITYPAEIISYLKARGVMGATGHASEVVIPRGLVHDTGRVALPVNWTMRAVDPRLTDDRWHIAYAQGVLNVLGGVHD